MREKYESLSLVVLKDLAKARGLKGISTMKKGELIDRMLQEDEREKEAAPKAKTVAEIAYEVGFSSPSYFTKCYKEQFGESPTEFLKRRG